MKKWFVVCLVGCIMLPSVIVAQDSEQPQKKRRYDPKGSAFMLTFNAEIPMMWSYVPSGLPMFNKNNLMLGFKIGSVRRTGWYLSGMSNFNFKGAFELNNVDDINYNVWRYSYVEGMLGIVARHCKPLSFHFGVGAFYYTKNYQEYNKHWGHLPSDVSVGPTIATGFMLHMGGFVLSAEAVGRANLKASSVPNAFSVGLKVGIGLCVGGNSNTKSKNSSYADYQEDFFSKPFVPKTYVPEEYRNVNRQNETLILTQDLDSLVVKLTVIVEQPSKEKAIPVTVTIQQQKPETPAAVEPQKQEENASADQNAKMKNPDILALDIEEETVPVLVTTVSIDTIRNVTSESEQKEQPEQPKQPEQAEQPKQSEQPKEPELPCGELVVIDKDGNTYRTIEMDNQCWMRENLRSLQYADGEKIALGDQAAAGTPYRYLPNGYAGHVLDFGFLYNWTAVMHGVDVKPNANGVIQGICPDGWHVPSILEWRDLLKYVASKPEFLCNDDKNNLSKALSASVAWKQSEEPCSVGSGESENNLTGFSAMPAGAFIKKVGLFGKAAGFWSSSVGTPGNACSIYLINDDSSVLESCDDSPEYGYSVRCVKTAK